MSDFDVDAVFGSVSSLGSGSSSPISNTLATPNDPPQSSVEAFRAAMGAATSAGEQSPSAGTNTPSAELNAAKLAKASQDAGRQRVSPNHWPAEPAFIASKLAPTVAYQLTDRKETARTRAEQTMKASPTASTGTARTRAPAVTPQQVADVPTTKTKPAAGVSSGDKGTMMGRPTPDTKPANRQSRPPAAQPPVSTEDTALEPQMPSIGVALMQGVWHGGRDLAQTGTALRGGRPEAESQRSAAAAALQWGDLLSPVSKLTPKLAYQLGQSWPTMAGGIVGSGLGVAAVGGPEDPLAIVTGPVGGAVGAGLMNGLQTFGNYFGDELHKTPGDPEGAYSRALERASVSGVFSGAAWAAFPARAFQGPLKNMMFQAFGVQPAINMGHQAADNALTGKPLAEGLGDAYEQGAIGTLPMAGSHYLGREVGRAASQVSQYKLRVDQSTASVGGLGNVRIVKKTGEPAQPMKADSTDPASTETARTAPAQVDPNPVGANRGNIAKEAGTEEARTGKPAQPTRSSSIEPGSTRTARTREPAQTMMSRPKVSPPTGTDIQAYRQEIGVPERQTVAVGRADVEINGKPAQLNNGKDFRDASPKVREEGRLPDQEPGVIKSPAEDSRGQKHAEEGVLSQFVKAIKAKYPKLKPVQVDGVDTYPQVKGTFYLHQSNPKGICSTCIQGIKPQIPPIEAGVFMQASRMLPNVDFVASTENVPGVTAVRGARLSFTLRNGKYVSGQ